MFEYRYHDAVYAMKRSNLLDDSRSVMSIRHVDPLLYFFHLLNLDQAMI